MKSVKRLFCLAVLFCGAIAICSEANAAQTIVTCNLTGVATFSEYIHVKCAEQNNGVFYFAYNAKQDQAGAARYMSMATSALISGRNVNIIYDPADQSGAAFGCKTDNCRLLVGLEIIGGGVN